MTFFKKSFGDDVLMGRVDVDDIISGSSNEKLCRKFEEVMKECIISMMVDMFFFLGLNVV